jgi:hypothetical protein
MAGISGITLAIAGIIVPYSFLPGTVARHSTLNGTPDRWESRGERLESALTVTFADSYRARDWIGARIQAG